MRGKIDLDRIAVITVASPPAVAPAPVTALELAALRRDRERVANLRAELGALALNLEAREQEIIARIEQGAPVHGPATVLVRRRQSISWFTVVVRELGEDAIERVRNTWPVAFWKELQLG